MANKMRVGQHGDNGERYQFEGLNSRVAMFNKVAKAHQDRQAVNPFSNGKQLGELSKPQFSKEEYGRPAKGSKSESRGFKASVAVSKDMLDCCEMIHDYGKDVPWPPKSGNITKMIYFGEIFTMYTLISDKLVGTLIRARKHKFLDFQGEILFQRRDDMVPIMLTKPIDEIRAILKSTIDSTNKEIFVNEHTCDPTVY